MSEKYHDSGNFCFVGLRRLYQNIVDSKAEKAEGSNHWRSCLLQKYPESDHEISG